MKRALCEVAASVVMVLAAIWLVSFGTYHLSNWWYR